MAIYGGVLGVLDPKSNKNTPRGGGMKTPAFGAEMGVLGLFALLKMITTCNKPKLVVV